MLTRLTTGVLPSYGQAEVPKLVEPKGIALYGEEIRPSRLEPDGLAIHAREGVWSA